MRDRLIELLKMPHKAEKLRQMGAAIGEYEDDCVEAMVADYLLANGVIVPPCKVGQTVYSCIGRPYKVERITVKSYQDHMTILLNSAMSGQLVVYETDFCKTVFLTREEAEEALEKMKGSER